MIIDNTNKNENYLTEGVLKDDELNEQGLLNVALNFFGLNRCLYVKTKDTQIVEGKNYYIYTDGKYELVDDPQVEDIDTYFEESKEKEVILFKQYLPLAELFCCRILDWSFLVKTRTFEEDEIFNLDEYTNKDEIESGSYVESENGIYKAYKMYKNFKFSFRLPDDFLKVKYINNKHNTGYAIKGKFLYTNSKTPTLDYLSDDVSSVPVDFAYLIAYRVAMEISTFIDTEAGQKASQQFSLTLQAIKENEDYSYRIENPKQDYFMNPNSSYWKDKDIVVR